MFPGSPVARRVGLPTASTAGRVRPRLRGLILLAAVPALLFVLVRLSGGETDRAAGIATVGTAALAAAVAVCGSFGRERRSRSTWFLVAIGLAIWAIGRLLAVLQVALPEDGPVRVALAQAGYLAMVPLVVAGIVLLLPRRRARTARLNLALDAAIGLASLLTIAWFFVLDPIWSADRLPEQAKVVGAVHALGNVALLMALLLVGLRHGHRPITSALAALAAGVLAFVVADTLALQDWLDGRPAGMPAEAVWIGAFLAIGLAALVERRAGAGADAGAVSADHEPLWRIVLPYPLALALVLLVVWRMLSETDPLRGSGTWILITCLTLVAVIIIRQGLTVRDQRRLAQHLSRQVDRDPLTGLINHRKVHERIAREFEHGREWGHPLAIALIDVDDFKAVNDTYGHLAGDQVLRSLANTLLASCRGTDVAARYAGDEFLLVLPGADVAAAHVVCDRILRQARAAAIAQGARDEPAVSLSIGVAVTHRYVRTGEQLVAIADAAMYDAKEAGKDSAVIVDADALIAEPVLQPRPESILARDAAVDPSERALALRVLVP